MLHLQRSPALLNLRLACFVCAFLQKGKSEKDLANLRQEMHILESLTECPYVIRMLDWFETASEICVVTEFAHGELFEILEDDSSLPEETVRQIAIQLVDGLRYLHANRIIHRDLKPQNLLIGGGGVIKLAGQRAPPRARSQIASAGCLGSLWRSASNVSVSPSFSKKHNHSQLL